MSEPKKLSELKEIENQEVQDKLIANLRSRPNSTSLYGQKGMTGKELQEQYDKYPELLRQRLNELIEVLVMSIAQNEDGISPIAHEIMVSSGDGTDNLDHAISATLQELNKLSKRSVGKKTEDGGEIFNDYQNNKALSQYAHAEGFNALAGAKAFSLPADHAYDSAKDQLADGSGYYYLGSVEGISDKLAEATDKKKLLYTVVLSSNYDLNGEILEVDEINKRVRVSNYLLPLSSGATFIDDESYLFLVFETTSGTTKTYEYIELGNKTIGEHAHAEGRNTKAVGIDSHTEGRETLALGKYAHTEGRETVANYCAHAEGKSTQALGEDSHSEGISSIAQGDHSHAEAYKTQAIGFGSHAEGGLTKSVSNYSHSEGAQTEAQGESSHAEGFKAIASGKYSHAEGHLSEAQGESSHAEGYKAKATGLYSHAEGRETVASGQFAHAGGKLSSATHHGSFVHGQGLQSGRNYQIVFGEYNKKTNTALFVVGNGSSTQEANAFTVNEDGTATVQTPPKKDNDVTTKGYVDSAHAVTQASADAALSIAKGANQAKVFDNKYQMGEWIKSEKTKNPDTVTGVHIPEDQSTNGIDYYIVIAADSALVEYEDELGNPVSVFPDSGRVTVKYTDGSTSLYVVHSYYGEAALTKFGRIYMIVPFEKGKTVESISAEFFSGTFAFEGFSNTTCENLTACIVSSDSESVTITVANNPDSNPNNYATMTTDDETLHRLIRMYNIAVGTNLYIRQTDVPDYWWDGSKAQELETQKVNLDGYVKTEYVDAAIQTLKEPTEFEFDSVEEMNEWIAEKNDCTRGFSYAEDDHTPYYVLMSGDFTGDWVNHPSYPDPETGEQLYDDFWYDANYASLTVKYTNGDIVFYDWTSYDHPIVRCGDRMYALFPLDRAELAIEKVDGYFVASCDPTYYTEIRDNAICYSIVSYDDLDGDTLRDQGLSNFIRDIKTNTNFYVDEEDGCLNYRWNGSKAQPYKVTDVDVKNRIYNLEWTVKRLEACIAELEENQIPDGDEVAY